MEQIAETFEADGLPSGVHQAAAEIFRVLAPFKDDPAAPGGGELARHLVEREGAVHASNVQLVCPECQTMTRIGRKILADGRKVRVCRKCEGVVDK